MKVILRRGAALARLVIDCLQHPLRHRRARRRLAAAGRPSGILFLCYGNICRSPYAEARMTEFLEARNICDIAIDSAGFFGPGRPANDVAQRLASARHLDLHGHRSKLATNAIIANADLVVVMTAPQASEAVTVLDAPASRVELLGDLDPRLLAPRDIPDPYGQSEADFLRVFDRIDRSLLTLIGTW